MIYNDIFSLDLKLFSKNKMKYIMDNKYSILIYIITIIIISWITIQFIIYIIYQFLRYYFFKNRSKNWLIEARRKYWIEILPPNINPESAPTTNKFPINTISVFEKLSTSFSIKLKICGQAAVKKVNKKQ